MSDERYRTLVIEVRENTDQSTGLSTKSATITPEGFRSDVVTVSGQVRFDPAALRTHVAYEIRWGCTCPDGTLENPDMVRNFIIALEKALAMQADWQREADARTRTG